MTPASLDDIEIRGAKLANVRRPFARPQLAEWAAAEKPGRPMRQQRPGGSSPGLAVR
jgi:hypothetical protein